VGGARSSCALGLAEALSSSAGPRTPRLALCLLRVAACSLRRVTFRAGTRVVFFGAPTLRFFFSSLALRFLLCSLTLRFLLCSLTLRFVLLCAFASLCRGFIVGTPLFFLLLGHDECLLTRRSFGCLLFRAIALLLLRPEPLLFG
jgi:hypothetical protein